jgi:excisionase family DNA binding protein
LHTLNTFSNSRLDDPSPPYTFLHVSLCVIADTLTTRYTSTSTATWDEDQVIEDQAALERRLDAGEWLSPGEVAKLLGQSRTTVHTLLKDGRIKYSLTTGGHERQHRRCDPADVRRLLDERRRVYADTPEEMLPPGPVKNAVLDALRTRGRGEPPPSPE